MDEGNPTPVIEDEGFKLEVIEEGAVVKDDATLALEAQIAELTAQKEALSVAPTPPTDGGMAALAEAIAKMNKAPEPVQAPSKEIDYEAILKEVDTNFYKDAPSQSMLKLMTPVLQQMKAETNKVTQTQAVQISKLTALADESNKQLYGKYSTEIEEVAKGLGAGESVYQQAIAQVKLNHIEDIIAERTQSSLATQVAAVEAEALKTPNIGSQPTVTSAGVPRQAAPRVASATPAEIETMKNFALQKGFNWNDQGDQEFIYTLYKKGGVR